MEHITTFTGENFTPLTPNIDHIKIEDIAHALSLTCRANGHIKRFYSVAQHCINCANEAKARGLDIKLQLACLLHDGSEAYLSDITKPVKKNLLQYVEIEKVLQELIYKKFLGAALSDDERMQIEEIDEDIFILEFYNLMEKKVFDEFPNLYSNPSFEFQDFITVKNDFLNIFNAGRGSFGKY